MKRNIGKQFQRVVSRVNRGFERLIDGYSFIFMKGLVNSINAGIDIKETADKLISDMFEDIDLRLNRKKDNSDSR